MSKKKKSRRHLLIISVKLKQEGHFSCQTIFMLTLKLEINVILTKSRLQSQIEEFTYLNNLLKQQIVDIMKRKNDPDSTKNEKMS